MNLSKEEIQNEIDNCIAYYVFNERRLWDSRVSKANFDRVTFFQTTTRQIHEHFSHKLPTYIDVNYIKHRWRLMRQLYARSNLKLKQRQPLTKGEKNIRSTCFFLQGHVHGRKNVSIEYHEQDNDDDINLDDYPDINLIENNNNTMDYRDGNKTIIKEEEWPIEYLETEVDEVIDAALTMNEPEALNLQNGATEFAKSSKEISTPMIAATNSSIQFDTHTNQSISSKITSSASTVTSVIQLQDDARTSYLSPSCTQTSWAPKVNEIPSFSKSVDGILTDSISTTNKRKLNNETTWSQNLSTSASRNKKKMSKKNEQENLRTVIHQINKLNKNTDESVAARARIIFQRYNSLNDDSKEIAIIQILEIFEKCKNK